jgi:hypothetical protein
MINIKPNAAWNKMSKIYGAKDIKARYDWFLFEYGKRATRLFYKHLLQQITEIPGTKNYKKALMMAEVRDRGRRAWWAIVASAKPIGNAQYSHKTSLLTVVSRFPDVENDPVKEILEDMGPWTAETIPFLPSPRAGQVVLKKVSEAEVTRVRESNLRRGEKTRTAMIKHGISFTPRHVVYQKLRIIEDIEMNALRIEFGLAEKSKPHWRPSLRWIKTTGFRRLEKDKDLIRLWLDPTFAKYRLFRHFRVKLTPEEVKRIQNFQDKIR